MVTRRRQVNKGPGHEPVPGLKKAASSRSGPMSRRSRFFQRRAYLACLVGFALLLAVYVGLYRDAEPLQLGNKAIDQLALSLSLHKQFHVVIIDAGSTASRVIAFTFHKSVVNGKLVLDDELFHQTTPGLSAYAKRPQAVKEPLDLLLGLAKSRIPKAEWSRTPLVMRATAGLRLLPGHEAEDILAECRRIFAGSGFQVADDSVEIMKGSDEGLFSWFSVNFLVDRFDLTGSSLDYAHDTVAALDLGGGSTQLTFALAPPELESLSPVHLKDLKHVNAFGRNMSIFTRSFLGLGLMAARKEILSHPDNRLDQPKSNQPDDGPVELRALCVNPIISKVEWNYGNQAYLVSGPVNGTHKLIKTRNFAGIDEDVPVVKFSACLDIIKKVVNTSTPRDLPSLADHEIYAFSYYFDRAIEAGLIDPSAGGVVALEAFNKAARDACQDPNTDQPFACLDLSFIYVLLHDGFGIDESTKISLRKKIKGHELSWALGAAFNVLDPDS